MHNSMTLAEAVRSRRTTKAFLAEPVPRSDLESMIELARWAPNHHLTEPWRFRVLGPQTLDRLEKHIGAEAMVKVRNAPTHIVVSAAISALPDRATEDLHATAAAAYALLLAATSMGYGTFWRTPAFLRDVQGAQICGVPSSEVPLGLIYVGRPAEKVEAPARRGISDIAEFLG